MCLVDLMGELPDFSMGPHHSLAYKYKHPSALWLGSKWPPFSP